MNRLAKQELFSLNYMLRQSSSSTAAIESVSFNMAPSSVTNPLVISFSGSYIDSPQSSTWSWNFNANEGIATGQYIKSANFLASQTVTINVLQAVLYKHMV